MICFAPTRRCRERNGCVWSLRSISMSRGILTLTLCRSTWRQAAIRRRCSPHTSTVSPLRWIMEHRFVFCARETWLEECEGHYQNCVCRGGAKRLLGRTWIFPLRRNLTHFRNGRLPESFAAMEVYRSHIS